MCYEKGSIHICGELQKKISGKYLDKTNFLKFIVGMI